MSKKCDNIKEKSEGTTKKVILTEDSYFGTRQRAIHQKCMECCGATAYKGIGAKTVRECQLKDCPLWIFRTGGKVSAAETEEQTYYMKKHKRKRK